MALAWAQFFGSFIDDPVVQQRMIASRYETRELHELSSFLRTDDSDKKVLHSGIGELHAAVPLNMYLYPNQHNAHPAARHAHRVQEMQWLCESSNAEIFFERGKIVRFGPIERFIFFVDDTTDTYTVNWEVDNYPKRSLVQSCVIPKTWFTQSFVRDVFKNARYHVFEVL